MSKFKTGGGRRHVASKDARKFWKGVKELKALLKKDRESWIAEDFIFDDDDFLVPK